MEGARNWRQGKGPQENGAGSDTKTSHSSKCRKKEHMKYRIMNGIIIIITSKFVLDQYKLLFSSTMACTVFYIILITYC